MKCFKNVFLLCIFMLLLMATVSCARKANLEVIEVSDYVRYRYIDKNSQRPDAVIEVYLNFKDTDYVSKGSKENDYYIISSNNKIDPLDLKVGDKLYFKVYYILEVNPEIVVGSYLYLVD